MLLISGSIRKLLEIVGQLWFARSAASLTLHFMITVKPWVVLLSCSSQSYINKLNCLALTDRTEHQLGEYLLVLLELLSKRCYRVYLKALVLESLEGLLVSQLAKSHQVGKDNCCASADSQPTVY